MDEDAGFAAAKRGALTVLQQAVGLSSALPLQSGDRARVSVFELRLT